MVQSTYNIIHNRHLVSRIMCTIGGLGRHIGRQSTDTSVDYRSTIGRQSTDKCVDRYSLKPSILDRYMTDT